MIIIILYKTNLFRQEEPVLKTHKIFKVLKMESSAVSKIENVVKGNMTPLE